MAVPTMATSIVSVCDESSYMKFMDISMGLLLADFIQSMNNHRLKTDASQNGSYYLKGKYMGYQDCIAIVDYSPAHQVVYRVDVALPVVQSWQELSQTYQSFKQNFTQKYGEPVVVEEEFQTDRPLTDDASRYCYAVTGRCKYQCIFEIAEGQACLMIYGNVQNKTAQVYTSFVDKNNIQLVRSAQP